VCLRTAPVSTDLRGFTCSCINRFFNFKVEYPVTPEAETIGTTGTYSPNKASRFAYNERRAGRGKIPTQEEGAVRGRCKCGA
jgi:hypothetical protein